MADERDYHTTLTQKGNKFYVTRQRIGSNVSVTFEVTKSGAVKDLSGATLMNSDISIVKTAFHQAGNRTMMQRVQYWWENG